ncbi:glycosyltransferase family 4 protein [Leeia oryzae]|uniref:glycosyltransferase family 4 protein n=1 Tax=Leeia oryzae TaxID=356662 RepID=UPI0003755B73|nr:glycosyltransferase family 4 protein [Leeia oryzae]
MRVALIRQKYNPFGGAERFVTKALDALSQDESIELSLITRRWKPSDSNRQAIVRVIECNPFSIGRTWRDWSFARAVRGVVAKERFDLVQSHERIDVCDIYRAGDGVHQVWLEHKGRASGFWGRLGDVINPYHRYVLAAEKRLFHSKRLKAVICNSRMVQQEIHTRFGLPLEKLPVIYSAVDTEKYNTDLISYREKIRQTYGIPQDALLTLFVGSGFSRKGVGPLINALKHLPDNVWCMIVGKDKQQKRFKTLAERLGVAHKVVFAGGQMDVRPFYGAADVFVLPTLYDAFPNAALEAFACGLPVITSPGSGAAEFVQNGFNGWVVDALDGDAIASKIKLLLDELLLEEMGRAAVGTVIHLKPEKMAVEMQQLYRQVLGLTP